MSEEQRPTERIAPEVNIDAALGKLNLAVRENQQLNEKQRTGLEHAIKMIEWVSDFRCRVMPIMVDFGGGSRVKNGMDRVHITAVERGRHGPNTANFILEYEDVNDKDPNICLVYEQGSPKLHLKCEIHRKLKEEMPGQASINSTVRFTVLR